MIGTRHKPTRDTASSSTSTAVSRRSRRRRWGWLGASLALAALLAGGAWLAGTRVRSPDQAAADAAAPARTVVTVPVSREVLESSVVTRGDVGPEVAVEVLGPTPESGEAVVTGVFVDVGDIIDSLVPVVEVSGRPVFVMEGERPVYRTIGPEMTGADVRQLQAGLTAGGCAAGDSGVYDEATKNCVAEIYESSGYALVRTSPTEESDLIAASEAMESAEDVLDDANAALETAEAGPTELELLDARQAVETARSNADAAATANEDTLRAARAAVGDALRELNGQLVAANPEADADSGIEADDGDTAGGAAGAGVAGRADAAAALREALDGIESARVAGAVTLEEANASLTRAEAALAVLEAPPDLADEQRSVEQGSQQLERAQAALAALQATSGPTVPLGELVFVPSLPATVDSLAAVVGDPTESGGAAMEVTDEQGDVGPLMVLSSAGLVVRAEVGADDASLIAVGDTAELLEESSGDVIEAEVTNVGSSLEQSQAGGLVSKVTLSGLDELPADWSGRNVRVTFVAASTGSLVLVVPDLSVSSGADGQERIEIVDDDGTIREVKVRTGLSTDGRVEVTPMRDDELEEGDMVVTDR